MAEFRKIIPGWSGCFRPEDSRWHMQAHHHAHYEMVLVVYGMERVAVGGRMLTVSAGEVLLFRPGMVHEEWGNGPEAFQSLIVGFHAGGRMPDWPLVTPDRDGRLRLMAAWLYEDRDSARPETLASRRELFSALLHEFARLQGQEAGEDRLVVRIRKLIASHLAGPLTVDQLAHEAGMSKYHFIRRFRALAGRTPMEEVRVARAARARELLLTTSLPLKNIAPMVGVGDVTSLYRLLKRFTGMAPRRIARVKQLGTAKK
jgi:AraC-like DNA-binding protein